MSRKRRRKQLEQSGQRASKLPQILDNKSEPCLEFSSTRDSEEIFNGIWSSEVLTLSEKIRMTKTLSDEIECRETESEVCEMNINKSSVIDKDITQVILQGWDCTIGDTNCEKTKSK